MKPAWRQLREGCFRRPLLPAAAAVVTGSYCGLLAPAQGSVAAAAGVAWLLALLAWRRRRSVRRLALGAALLLTAWMLATRAAVQRAESTAALLAAQPARVEVEGRIGVPLRVRPASRGERVHRFELRDAHLWSADEAAVSLARLPLLVDWYAPAGTAPPETGERWVFRARVATPGTPGARRRLLLVSRRDNSRRLAAPAVCSLAAAAERWRRATAGRLGQGLAHRPRERALIHAMLLGYRGDMPNDLYRIFRDSGTLHIFAISGSHVVVIAGILLAAMTFAGVPRRAWVLLLAPLLGFYAVATGNQPSALRAVLMAVLYLAAPLCSRAPDSFSALAGAALVLLAIDPYQAVDAGLVLSFTVVAGLVLLAPPFSRRLRRWLRLDLWLEDERARERFELPTPRSRLRRLLLLLAGQIADLAALSLAAWLTSVPLSAYYFQRFTPAALPANLLVVPLSFLVVLSGTLSLAAGLVVAALGTLLNQVTLALTVAMTAVAGAAAALPGGNFIVPPPPPWLLAAAYALLAFWGWRLDTADRATPAVDASWMAQAPRGRLGP